MRTQLKGLALAGVTAASALFAGQASAVEIEYWQYFFDARVQAMEQLIANFEAANPDVTVTMTHFPYADYRTKVAAAIPAGEGPDVVQLFYGWLNDYIEAELIQANNSYERGQKLYTKSVGFLSDSEMDALVFEVKSLEAQLKVAHAMIQQAEASLENSRANLNYCEITAPVDGVIIDRKIDPGQTLAASFQTPELFIVAPDLRDKVHVFASVDEADIGLVQKAQAESRPVTFTVDAHPDELFSGEIEQIRVSSVANQNVVTYPVVIVTSNPDLKLLPGMTASISFEVDSISDVPK